MLRACIKSLSCTFWLDTTVMAWVGLRLEYIHLWSSWSTQWLNRVIQFIRAHSPSSQIANYALVCSILRSIIYLRTFVV
jgi:hypothetical protein